MSREMLAAAVLMLVIGALVGWCAGWVARGDENRRWAESCRRRIDYAETLAREAAAELERVNAQRLNQSWTAGPAPQIHVHVQPSLVMGYHDLTSVAARALADQQPQVLEAGP